MKMQYPYSFLVSIWMFGYCCVSNSHSSIVLSDLPLLDNTLTDILVMLKSPLESVLADISKGEYESDTEKREILVTSLEKANGESQLPVISLLEDAGVKFIPFWIVNAISVRDAPSVLIEVLLGLDVVVDIIRDELRPFLPRLISNPSSTSIPPGNEIQDIIDPLTPLLFHKNLPSGASRSSPEWGVAKIGAPEVWKTTKGKGIRVAIIDTGVRGSHSFLRDNYVGDLNNGWMDVVEFTHTPMDGNGHGTHCTGSAVGTGGVGVAPEAKWMACRAMDSDGWATWTTLIDCGQWVVCPTDAQGNNKNCSKTPHIVSNSWGGGQNDYVYNEVIQVWNSAGIIPIFAVGNNGPNCSTAYSPADQPGVISVTSTDINEQIHYFANRGPKIMPDGEIVPHIAAPGGDINSTWNGHDFDFQVFSGTSMATPYVAGAVALLLSANQTLKLDQIKYLILSTAFKQLNQAELGPNCGNLNQDVYPNDIAGYGRLAIDAAFKLLNRF